MARAFVFPGQGSQFVGMGQPLAERFATAREVFEEVDDALGRHLARLMFSGADSDLRLTENAQPALMAVSMAMIRILTRDGGLDLQDRIACVAGHSLGEYTALCAAGAFSLADTARLLAVRGRAMQAAVPVGEGAMAAVLGMELADVEAMARTAAGDDVCTIANDNAPGQLVISGHAVAVDRAIALAAAQRKKTVRLPVSAPFHCRLMAPAADRMATALAATPPAAPRLPVIANVTAGFEADPAAWPSLLVRQVTGRVRWRETVVAMAARDVDRVYEIGAGKVLTGLTRRIDRRLAAVAVGGPDDLESLMAGL